MREVLTDWLLRQRNAANRDAKSLRRRLVASSLGACLCVACPAVADGNPSQGRLSVVWDAPARCPDVARVRATVASMLERSTPGTFLELAATGTVTEHDGRFALRIQLDSKGASETKTIDADACETLADAFAFIVAFTFDPTVGRRPWGMVAAPQPERMPSVAVRRREVPTAVARNPTSLAAGPLIASGAGALPFPAYGVGALVAVDTGPRWELAGMFWPEQSASVVDGSHTVGASVWLATVRPSACASFAHGAIASCAGGELGTMQGRGTGVPNLGSGRSWWLAVSAGLSVRAVVAPRVSLRFRLDVGLPFFRPSFVLDNVGPGGSVQAFQPAPAFGVLSFEPEFELFSTALTESRHVSH